MEQDTGLVPAERHEEIVRRLAVTSIGTVKELASELGVHEMTIRRDLDALAEQGLVERVRGGARIRSQASAEVAYHMRVATNVKQKEAIARAALGYVQDGDSIGFDASTTALTLIKMLSGQSINAIVSSLDAANTLASMNVPFVLVGGTFNPSARSFGGTLTEPLLSRLHLDKVFFSAKGFSLQAGFTDSHLAEVEAKERLIASGRIIIALLDHSKFGREAFGTITTANKIDVVITDRQPEDEYSEALKAAGVQLVVAS